jgi:formate dehydrogenase subunit delta
MQQHQTLVTMVNQIGEFFRSQGDEESAERSVAVHLRHFWAPSMRRDLVSWLDQHEGDGLKPLVKASVEKYRRQLVDPSQRMPGEEGLEQPKGGGDAG